MTLTQLCTDTPGCNAYTVYVDQNNDGICNLFEDCVLSSCAPNVCFSGADDCDDIDQGGFIGGNDNGPREADVRV